MWSLDLHTQQELVILKDNISQCRCVLMQITVCLKEKLILHHDPLIVMWSSAPPVGTVALYLLWFWKESDDGRSLFFFLLHISMSLETETYSLESLCYQLGCGMGEILQVFLGGEGLVRCI